MSVNDRPIQSALAAAWVLLGMAAAGCGDALTLPYFVGDPRVTLELSVESLAPRSAEEDLHLGVGGLDLDGVPVVEMSFAQVSAEGMSSVALYALPGRIQPSAETAGEATALLRVWYEAWRWLPKEEAGALAIETRLVGLASSHAILYVHDASSLSALRDPRRANFVDPDALHVGYNLVRAECTSDATADRLRVVSAETISISAPERATPFCRGLGLPVVPDADIVNQARPALLGIGSLGTGTPHTAGAQ